MKPEHWPQLLPIALVVFGLGALSLWWRHEPQLPLPLRVPGSDERPADTGTGAGNPVLRGALVTARSAGTVPEHSGFWPQFRGPRRDGVDPAGTRLARQWGPTGPRQLWKIEVGEGYAGPAVVAGRVYLMDYLRETQEDALRCLSLADGVELWRYAYPVAVKRNHGMSRTVPTVSSNRVVAIGPKCHVICVDALTGVLQWGIDLVEEHGTTVPPWYAGQCPLIDQGQVILAPGGPEALLMAVDLETGRLLWRTPNPMGWRMTHSSVMSVEIHGQPSYVYCASGGVVGVAPEDGRILWQTPDWKISIAMVPSPVPLPGGRIFLSGGYNAGSMMLSFKGAQDGIQPVIDFRLPARQFGATQHTPILFRDHLYGIHPDGPLVCLDLSGQTLWSSEPAGFGLGPFLIADGLIYAMDDRGTLTLAEATPEGYRQLARADILQHGHDAWAPFALAADRLLLRDLTQLVCLDVGVSP